MPRRPKFIHPLKLIRAAIGGKTQAQFAALVGVTPVTIKRIEGDTLDLSYGLALRIGWAVGADGEELRKGKHGKALNVSGMPYSKKDFDDWSQRFSHQSPEERAETLTDDLSFWLGIVAQAVAPTGHAKRSAAFQKLSGALRSIVIDFKLDATVKRLLDPYTQRGCEGEDAVELDVPFNPSMSRPILKAKWRKMSNLPKTG